MSPSLETGIYPKILHPWGAAADRRRVDLEFRPEWRTAYMAQHDADEDAAHTGPSALAESDGVSARRDAIKLSSVVSDLLGVSGLRILWALARGESDPKKLADFGRRALAVQRGATYRFPDRQPAADAPATAFAAIGTTAIDRRADHVCCLDWAISLPFGPSPIGSAA